MSELSTAKMKRWGSSPSTQEWRKKSKVNYSEQFESEASSDSAYDFDKELRIEDDSEDNNTEGAEETVAEAAASIQLRKRGQVRKQPQNNRPSNRGASTSKAGPSKKISHNKKLQIEWQ
jgi:hypothetical protein